MATHTTLSYRSTVDRDPFAFYEAVRTRGDIVWDDEMQAWLATSYDAAKQVMRNDKVLFRHPYKDMLEHVPGLLEVEGPRNKNFLHGDEHTPFHRWFLHRFSPTAVDLWRDSLLVPIADRLIDEFAPAGRAELVDDFADRFSIRVIAGVMGLPWQDDAWLAHAKELLDAKQRFLDAHGNDPDGTVTATAITAAKDLAELLMPFIDARCDGAENDLISIMWRDGNSLRPDWCEEDIVSNVTHLFFAGTDTTTHAIANAFHAMLTTLGLPDQLRSGGRPAIERYAEETLRLWGSPHFRPRIANVDTEICGVPIAAGETVVVLIVGANHDEQRFACPHEIQFDRKAPRDHLSFSFGPQSCGGAALARAEIQEAVARVLERLPNMRLDAQAEPPAYTGFLLRSFRPLHVLFDPS